MSEKMKKAPDYWDITIFIPPEMVKRLPADCGDCYDDRFRDVVAENSRDFRRHFVDDLSALMDDDDHGPIGAWGASKAKEIMLRAMDEGLTIAIDKSGKLRVFLGDGMLESHRLNTGTDNRGLLE
ncbi:MAG: hypothetical protein WC390_10305 [Sulfurimonas sp.]